MYCGNLVFTNHAIQQMFFRRISKRDVETVIAYGETIEEDANDRPFPSYLILDFVSGTPIHIVFSYDEVNDIGYVVTAYIPDPLLWDQGFSKRR